jgi:prolipoprotein diacylglyceryltransferase
VTRHPVEIYATLLFLLAAIALAAWKAYGRPNAGVPASLALLTAGAVRLVTEPLRPSLTGGPIWWYAVGVAVGVIGIVGFTLRAHRSR